MSKLNGMGTGVSLVMCVLIVLIIGSGIVAIVGTTTYVSEKKALSIYKKTSCLVTNYTLIRKNCTSETCTGSGFFRTCRKHYNPCNTESYGVKYNVSNGPTIETAFNGTGGPGANSANHTYTCYYKSANPKVFRWDWPQPRQYLIMLIVGWICFGVFILTTIGAVIYICRSPNSANYKQLP